MCDQTLIFRKLTRVRLSRMRLSTDDPKPYQRFPFIIIAISIIIALHPDATAQVLIGPVAGPQVSWVSFDEKHNRDLYQQYPTIGYHAGFGVSFRVQDRFFLHTALLYSQKGKKLSGKTDELLKFNGRYRYIDMPLVYTVEFKQNLGKSKQYKWFFGLGPNVSYWLGGKGSLENSQLSEILVNRINYKIVYNQAPGDFADDEMNVNDANRLQLGLNVSGGIVLEPLGYQKIMVTVRYEFGHSFMSPNSLGEFNLTNEYYDDLRVRPQGFRLSFSYLIDLKTDQAKKGKSTINKKKMK
jgi:hypothetical protein